MERERAKDDSHDFISYAKLRHSCYINISSSLHLAAEQCLLACEHQYLLFNYCSANVLRNEGYLYGFTVMHLMQRKNS